MTVEFVRKGWYWLPRQAGGFSGPYMEIPPNVGYFFNTDGQNLWPDNTIFPWDLPPWFPRQSLITGIQFGYQSIPPQSGIIDFEVWLDPKGAYYQSLIDGVPEDQSPLNSITSLGVFLNEVVTSQNVRVDLPVPAPLDRDQGDRLGLSIGTNTSLSWIYCAVDILVPAPFQPAVLTS